MSYKYVEYLVILYTNTLLGLNPQLTVFIAPASGNSSPLTVLTVALYPSLYPAVCPLDHALFTSAPFPVIFCPFTYAVAPFDKLFAVAVPSDVNVPVIPAVPSNLPTFTPAFILFAFKFAIFPVILESPL